MRWKVHGRRTMYESDWVNVYVDDVELPDGSRISHHVLTMPKGSQTAVVLNSTGDQVLLIWRHRFIPDRWGWEVPAGWVEHNEDPKAAIAREILEETGYKAGNLTRMFEYDAIPGISTMHLTCWLATRAQYQQAPDGLEASKVTWHSRDSVVRLLQTGKITDGPSLTALSYFLSVYKQDTNASDDAS